MLPAAMYLVAAFALGSIDADPMPNIRFDLRDKLMHGVVFAGMQWTHFRAWRFFFPEWGPRRLAWSGGVTATLAGGLLEAWQFLLPHRTAEWGDFLADGLGAGLAALLTVRLLGRGGSAA